MFFNQYPYLNLNDFNLDYILKSLKELSEQLKNFIKINTIKYANPIQWNITTQYEANTVVLDPNSGIAYLSIKPIPSGVNITNTDYWTPIFTLNLLSANQNITLRDDGNGALSTFASVAGDWVIWGGVLYKVIQAINVNEAYVIGYNITRYTVELFIKDYINAIYTYIGDLTDLNTTDKSSVVNAINSLVTDINATIGDLTDLNTTDKSSVVNAINELNSKIIDIENDVITPYDFGAVGDGITDDTVAFQNMLANNSKPIFVNHGTFKISDTLDIPSDCLILGSKESLILNNVSVGSAGSFNALFNIDDKENITIDGVNIKGINETITQGSSQYRTCININDSEHITIKNCNITWSNDLYTISAKNSNYLKFENNYINHYNYIGINLLVTCKHCDIIRNTVMNCDNYSYNANGQCYPISFSGYDHVLTTEEMNDDILIDGNTVIQETVGTWEGISGHGGNNITIVNNYVKGTYSGICIDTSSSLNFDANNVIIANNYVELTQTNYLNVIKHNEAIVIGGRYIDVHDNVCKYGGYAGSLLASYNDPMAMLIRGCKNAKIHNNIFNNCRANLFKLKLDNIDIHIYDNDITYFYWTDPYGSLKACVFNLQEATSIKSLIVEGNTIENFDNNDWFVFGKSGDSTNYATDPYILFRDNRLLTARSLINYNADNIIIEQSDITNVKMGKVGDIIYNPSATAIGDVIAWVCTKEWRAGASGLWTPITTIA